MCSSSNPKELKEIHIRSVLTQNPRLKTISNIVNGPIARQTNDREEDHKSDGWFREI